eukprot:gene21453-28422_t
MSTSLQHAPTTSASFHHAPTTSTSLQPAPTGSASLRQWALDDMSPGSPLHQVVASGRMAYERIERFTPTEALPLHRPHTSAEAHSAHAYPHAAHSQPQSTFPQHPSASGTQSHAHQVHVDESERGNVDEDASVGDISPHAHGNVGEGGCVSGIKPHVHNNVDEGARVGGNAQAVEHELGSTNRDMDITSSSAHSAASYADESRDPEEGMHSLTYGRQSRDEGYGHLTNQNSRSLIYPQQIVRGRGGAGGGGVAGGTGGGGKPELGKRASGRAHRAGGEGGDGGRGTGGDSVLGGGARGRGHWVDAVSEVEDQMLSLTLEREAMEKALTREQGEVRLLVQELELQQGVVDALEATVEEVRQQLSDAQLALAHETGGDNGAGGRGPAEGRFQAALDEAVERVQEEGVEKLREVESRLEQRLSDYQLELQQCQEELRQGRQQVEEAALKVEEGRQKLEEREGEIQALQQMMEEQRQETRIQLEGISSALEQRGEQQLVLLEELRTAQMETHKMTLQHEFEAKREEAVEMIAERNLMRRALQRWAQGISVYREDAAKDAAAHRLFSWRACYRCFRQWHRVVELTTALRKLHAQFTKTHLAAILTAWQEYAEGHRSRASAVAYAQGRQRVRLLRGLLAHWRKWVEYKQQVVGGAPSPDSLVLAVSFSALRPQRSALLDWHHYVCVHLRPKINARSRATRTFHHSIMRKSFLRWLDLLAVLHEKRKVYRRMQLLHTFHLCRRVLILWGQWVRVQQRVTEALTKGRLSSMLAVILSWRQLSEESRCMKRKLNALVTRIRRFTLSHVLSSWMACTEHRQAKQRKMVRAVGHQRRLVLHRCFWAWVRVAELSAMHKQKGLALQEYMRMVQAVARWQALSAGLSRRHTIVQRAVRMHGLRVVLAGLRSAFNAWLHLAAVARTGRRISRGVFVTAYRVMHVQDLKRRSFYGWQRLCALSFRQTATLARAAADSAETAHRQNVRGMEASMEAVAARCCKDHLSLQSLKKKTANIPHKHHNAQSDEIQRLASSLSTTAGHLNTSSVEADHLRSSLLSSEETCEALRGELAFKEQAVGQSLQEIREAGLGLAQVTSRHEQEVSSLKEELSDKSRLLVAHVGAAKRAEQLHADGLVQMSALRTMYEGLLSVMRKDLRLKEERVQFLEAHFHENSTTFNYNTSKGDFGGLASKPEAAPALDKAPTSASAQPQSSVLPAVHKASPTSASAYHSVPAVLASAPPQVPGFRSRSPPAHMHAWREYQPDIDEGVLDLLPIRDQPRRLGPTRGGRDKLFDERAATTQRTRQLSPGSRLAESDQMQGGRDGLFEERVPATQQTRQLLSPSTRLPGPGQGPPLQGGSMARRAVRDGQLLAGVRLALDSRNRQLNEGRMGMGSPERGGGEGGPSDPACTCLRAQGFESRGTGGGGGGGESSQARLREQVQAEGHASPGYEAGGSGASSGVSQVLRSAGLSPRWRQGVTTSLPSSPVGEGARRLGGILLDLGVVLKEGEAVPRDRRRLSLPLVGYDPQEVEGHPGRSGIKAVMRNPKLRIRFGK